jgi:transcriptional regulator with XRE-family HTH domain
MITLKQLRETSGLSQKEVCYATNVSPTRLSLFENSQGNLSVTEQEQVRQRIVSLSADRAARTKERSSQTVIEASSLRASEAGDRRLVLAMKTIGSRPSSQKLFASVKESRGYSDLEAAVFTLGRNYPD